VLLAFLFCVSINKRGVGRFQVKERGTHSAEGWSQLYGKPVSQEECREICDNLCGFFSVLKEWDDKERRSAENERDCDLRNSSNSC
jgi:hypothetical protein